MFQFEFIKIIFSYGIWMAGSVYGIREKVKGTNGLLLLGSSIIATIVFNYFFNYLNKKISQKHRYYEKIHKFQEAHRIYCKINAENSNF